MKKALTVFAVVALLGIGTIAFAHGGGGYGMMGGSGGYGMMGGGGGGMMRGGGGYGGHMTGGYGMMGGGGMMGRGTGSENDTETREFLDKTAELRKELHDKRFEYMEAWRTGDEKKVEELSKELENLREKLLAEAPKGRNGSGSGYCW